MMKSRRMWDLIRRRKSMIDIDFEFHPVGQGLFYSGIFTHRNGNQFSMVYDCGSDSTLSYLDQQIESFVRRLEPKDKKMLDVLFISHFHRDHINRISQLLKKTKGAKYAILPYLNEDELFLALTDYLNSDNLLDEQGDLDPNILELLSNPVSFFRERNVEKIIFIHPDADNDNDEGFDTDNDKPDEPDFSNFKFTVNLNLETNTKEKSKDSDVLHYFSKGILTINKFWEFKLFNKPRVKVIIDGFKKDIENLTGSTDLSTNIFASYIKKNDKKFKKQFQDLYFKHFGAGSLINQTSLIVYHGALDKNKFKQTYSYNHFSDEITGTFLCADITLDVNCIDDLKRKWPQHNRYFDNVAVFQVPHHGSANDMNVQVFQEFTRAEIWLINFGLGNTHKHPRKEIIDMLVDNRKERNILSNTQINGFHYYFQYYR